MPFEFNDPAKLLDCPECDGQYYPWDKECSFCHWKNPDYKDVE